MNLALNNLILTLITISVLAAPTYGHDLMIGKKFPPEFSTLGERPCTNHQRVPDLVDLVNSKAKNH